MMRLSWLRAMSDLIWGDPDANHQGTELYWDHAEEFLLDDFAAGTQTVWGIPSGGKAEAIPAAQWPGVNIDQLETEGRGQNYSEATAESVNWNGPTWTCLSFDLVEILAALPRFLERLRCDGVDEPSPSQVALRPTVKIDTEVDPIPCMTPIQKRRSTERRVVQWCRNHINAERKAGRAVTEAELWKLALVQLPDDRPSRRLIRESFDLEGKNGRGRPRKFADKTAVKIAEKVLAAN